MINATIAGHKFVNGRCSLAVNGVDCGRRWVDIRNYTDADVGTSDIAHIGNLNANEAREIMAQKRKEEVAMGYDVDPEPAKTISHGYGGF
jgi:hypothetical protein